MKTAMFAALATVLGCTAPLATSVQGGGPPLPESGVLRQKLPAPAKSVTIAGGGRYLVFHLAKLRQLAVFDLTTAKVAKYLPMGGDDLRIAGGMDCVLVVSNEPRLIQRWDLKTFEKTLTLALDETAPLDAFIMGGAGAGPAMLLTRRGIRFYDPKTLKKISYKQPDNFWMPHPSHPLRAYASLDGLSFAAWAPGISPNGIRLMTLHGNSHTLIGKHTSAGYTIPSPDGTLMLTSKGVFSQELTELNAERFKDLRCLPSLHPAYFIAVKGTGPYYGRKPKEKPVLSVYTTTDRQLLASVPNLGELFGAFSAKLPIDQRIHYSPAQNLLVTLEPTNEEIILRRLSVVDVLKKSGVDYLFAESVPPKRAKAGDTYTYEVAVQSARGKVKVALNTGPEGMKLKRRKLTWKVPVTQKPGPASVIMTLSDASGQEVFHSFNILVENEGAIPEKK